MGINIIGDVFIVMILFAPFYFAYKGIRKLADMISPRKREERRKKEILALERAEQEKKREEESAQFWNKMEEEKKLHEEKEREYQEWKKDFDADYKQMLDDMNSKEK